MQYEKLTLEDLKKLHDKAYQSGYDTRLKAADDMLFAYISQWDDTYLQESDIGFRGEFNICRKATRQILTDLVLNPVQVDFDPIDDTNDSAADLIDGMYRSDMRNNTAQEAKQNASQETVVCGVGAWELRAEYKTNRAGDDRQVIRRYPLFEANNNVMWDPNAKLKDKSDANYVSCLVSYSEDGYKDLVHELTGRDMDDIKSGNAGDSFKSPEISYVFPWISESNKIYVTRFYHRVKRDIKYYTFTDMFGASKTISELDMDDHEDEMAEGSYELTNERTVKRYVVTKYIASGDEILEESIIPGEHIPVIPQYGERAHIEGEEHYEGIIRLAKDPQRLRNFQMSYLADIVSMSPREKPIFTAEQIQGFEDMYEIAGSDNNLPYTLQNANDANGNPLPVGPVGYIKAPEVPPALMMSMQETRAAVDDVAGAGLPADITDTDLSGKAIQSMQKRLDMQSYTYQDNHKHAVRRDGEVYASMARDVYDSEQEVALVKVDGTRTKEMINSSEMNYDTMNTRTINDVTSMTFDVYADIGPSFESVKEQNKEELKELINGSMPGSPEYTMLMNTYLTLVDGSLFKDLRDYGRKQLILAGVKPPETDEEKAMMDQAAQEKDNQQDPLMLEGQARMMEGEAALQDKVNDANKIAVDEFEAETGRQKVQIQAAEAGVKIRDTQVSTVGKQIDNTLKLRGAVG